MIAPLAGSKAARAARVRALREELAARPDEPVVVRASASTDVSAENMPFIGGLNAVGCPVFRSIAARLRRSTPPAFVNVPPATTSEPFAPIARTPADWPDGSCSRPRPSAGAKLGVPVDGKVVASTPMIAGCGRLSMNAPLPM